MNKTFLAGHQNLRKGRVSLAGQIYFITVCCLQRRPLLRSHAAARAAARTLHQLHADQHVNIHAWVLMPDHLHCLIELGEMQSLPACMGRINSCVAKAINRAIDRKGAVWQGAYFDRALRRDEDVNTAIRYLLNNPIRSGLVENIEAYPYWNVSNWNVSVLSLD